MDDLLQDITLYHKTNNGYVIYPLIASYRGTSILNRNTTGVNTTDSILIRIFLRIIMHLKYLKMM